MVGSSEKRDEAYWQSLLSDEELHDEGQRSADEGVEAEFARRLGADVPEHFVPEAEAAAAPRRETDQDWQAACEALDKEQILELLVTECNRGGLLVRLGELSGFVPCSQLESLPPLADPDTRLRLLQELMGQKLKLRVIEADRDRGRLVLSEKVIIGAGSTDPLDRLSPGDVCKGRVIQVRPFGAFVNIGGVEGLLHISELSWGWVSHPADVVQEGDDMEVYVIGVNQEERKVALSLKRLSPDPWTLVDEHYSVGDLVDGLITNVVSFGAFMQLEEGLEGLIHVSELANGNFMHPRMVVTEGKRVTARVMSIDSAKRRLALSLRQAQRTGFTTRADGAVQADDGVGQSDSWSRRAESEP